MCIRDRFLVQRTLIKIANASGVKIEPEQKRSVRPLWKAVVENQFIMFVLVIGFLLSSAYFTYGYLMQIGIDQGYALYSQFIILIKFMLGQIKLNASIVILLQEFLNTPEFHHLMFV